jgi:hypothetical protein
MEPFETIRRGHADGETIRQLAKRHKVHSRMVRQSLDGAIAPERRKPRGNNRNWVRSRSSLTRSSTTIRAPWNQAYALDA